jgi:hypothetical protein
VVPSSILNAMISRQLAGSSCVRMLSGNGITTPDLTVKGAQHSKEAFESFRVPEDKIEAALKAFYSI